MAMTGFGLGRVTRDAEMKNSDGNSVINFSLAVERSYQNDDGTRPVDFLSFVAWDKTAEAVAKYLKKGNLISYSYSDARVNDYDKDGARTQTFQFTLDQFEVLQQVKRDQEAPKAPVADAQPEAPAQEADEPIVDDSDLPF